MSLVVWTPALCLASHVEALAFKYAGARYHVKSRCNRREAIFYDADRVEFLRTLGQACLKSDRLRIGSASYVSHLLSSVDSKL
jgi:REP element-mobilizing transposase RayT